MSKKLLLIAAILLFIKTPSKAQEEKYIGLFVYNFTKYFNWPNNNDDFVIEVLGHKSVYTELSRLSNGKRIGMQNIIVKHLVTPEQISQPNILFIGHWQTRHLTEIKGKIGNKPILLITEKEGLIGSSVINFIIRDGIIKFEFNSTNAKLVGLQFMPEIKQLAFKVVD